MRPTPVARSVGRRRQRRRERAHAAGRHRLDASRSTSCRRAAQPRIGDAGRRLVRRRSARRRLPDPPGVDTAEKVTAPLTWRSPASTRADAQVVSQVDGRPAYGGTPSDATVVAAIQDLKARGLEVMLAPFILMDVPGRQRAARSLTGATAQPAYPWRGRITVAPAPGQPGTPDKTAAAATQVAAFLGTAEPADFAVAGGSVDYSGPAEWTYRRMVLHYAHLARGRRRRRRVPHRLGAARPDAGRATAPATYPVRAGLVDLAADVQSVLGPARRSPTPRTGASISATSRPTAPATCISISIRSGPTPTSISSASTSTSRWPTGATAGPADEAGAALALRPRLSRANIARRRRLRLVLCERRGPRRAECARRSPTALRQAVGVPLQGHQVAGGRTRTTTGPAAWSAATPTAWVPQGKPIWLTELGCPAVDKGANQPNVFFDPKTRSRSCRIFRAARATTSCSAAICRRFSRALRSGRSGLRRRLQPRLRVYGGRMIDPEHIHVWAWDARPYPAFPDQTDVWGDGANWRARPLDQRPPRQRAARCHRRGDPRRLRLPRHRCRRARPASAGYVIDRVHVGARCAAAARAGLLLRRARERRPYRLRAIAARSRRRRADARRSGRAAPGRARSSPSPARRRPTCRPPPSSPYLRRRRLSARPSRRRAGSSARAAAWRSPICRSCWSPSRLPDRRDLAVRGLGRARARRFALPPSRLALEPGDAVSLTDRRPHRACCASPRSASTASATSKPAASIPTSIQALRRRSAPPRAAQSSS